MNCEETGLQKYISDSAEMRQVFCKTILMLFHAGFSPRFIYCSLASQPPS